MSTEALVRLYARLFARRRLYRWNRFLYDLSLRGIGVMNHEDDRLSGERAFLAAFLRRRPAAVVFDVGANVGAYASLVKAIAPGADVWAFEPHPATFARLSRVAETRGFRAVNVGCGNADGPAELFDYADGESSTHASLYPDTFSTLRRAPASAVAVQLRRVDSWCAEHRIARLDLLKIDAEGHELPVLDGAGDLLRAGRIACVQLEFNEHQAMSRTFLRDFRDRLPGYDLFRLLPDGPVALEAAYSPRYWEIFGFQNIVAVRREGA